MLLDRCKPPRKLSVLARQCVPTPARIGALIACACVATGALSLGAGRAGAQSAEPAWRLETRIDAITARSTALHAGVGASGIIGTYARIALLAGAGARVRDGTWSRSGRFDAIARFHFDPFQQAPRAVYVAGGAGLFFDDDTRTRVRAVVALGIEGRRLRGGWEYGAEVGLGGGVRVGVSARRARNGAR